VLRLQRVDAAEIDNLEGWLTTVVARICLNITAGPRSHPEDPLDAFVPEPIVSIDAGDDPEPKPCSRMPSESRCRSLSAPSVQHSVSRSCWHDMFGVPFDEIAALIERSPEPPGKLASRARRRVEVPRRSLTPTWLVSGLSSTRTSQLPGGRPRRFGGGIDPDVVARSHCRTACSSCAAPRRSARAAMMARKFAPFVRPALINRTVGAVAFDEGIPFAILAFSVVDDRAVSIDIFNDRELVPRLVRSDS